MPDIFVKCSCGGCVICAYCAQLTIATIAIIAGALITWRPRKAIDLQIAFYRLINWKMEPISMEKEVRKTRIMGAILLTAGILSFACIYLF